LYQVFLWSQLRSVSVGLLLDRAFRGFDISARLRFSSLSAVLNIRAIKDSDEKKIIKSNFSLSSCSRTRTDFYISFLLAFELLVFFCFAKESFIKFCAAPPSSALVVFFFEGARMGDDALSQPVLMTCHMQWQRNLSAFFGSPSNRAAVAVALDRGKKLKVHTFNALIAASILHSIGRFLCLYSSQLRLIFVWKFLKKKIFFNFKIPRPRRPQEENRPRIDFKTFERERGSPGQ
jgi:hypothetical protein